MAAAPSTADGLRDRLEVLELIRMERYWRDTARWDRLAAVYTPDSRVRTTWFDGSGPDFAEASRDMAARGRLSRHLITPTYVRLEGDHGIVDSYGEIHNREPIGDVEVDILMYCRFFSRVARTAEGWRLASFDGIYLKDQLTPVDPGATLPIDWAEVESFPRPSYRVWAYTLSLKGYEIGTEELGEDRPEQIEAFMGAAEAWLGEGSERGDGMAVRFIDPEAAEWVRSLCEALVPGSAAVAPELYVDALIGELPEGERAAAARDLEEVARAAERGELAALAGTPAFERARVMAVEAYYSDFAAAGAPGPGAYRRIGFEFPLSLQVRKDWSFMGIEDR